MRKTPLTLTLAFASLSMCASTSAIAQDFLTDYVPRNDPTALPDEPVSVPPQHAVAETPQRESSPITSKARPFGVEFDLGLAMPTGIFGVLFVYRPCPYVAFFAGVGIPTPKRDSWPATPAVGARLMPDWGVRPYVGSSVSISGPFSFAGFWARQDEEPVASWDWTMWVHIELGLEVDVSDAMYLGLSFGRARAVNEPATPGLRSKDEIPYGGLMFGARP